MKDKIAIGCDHAGFVLKTALIEYLKNNEYEVIDLGTNSEEEQVDYPDYAKLVGKEVGNGNAKYGILICGTGIGISISANRMPKIRAALCYETKLATLAREHNDANILVLGGRIIAPQKAIWILEEFLNTKFSNRHQQRVEKIELGDIKNV
ncbi:ribose 5-phosphate isomerase B [Spiroplasma endosymbiont of Clivina fossor]|uniref:ribose 5-phosphate isomerase B n=1 Tax=Spiroplasma endosymbiont of Clivina fossor TaxID=3066282 RepID=UPI00313DDE3B